MSENGIPPSIKKMWVNFAKQTADSILQSSKNKKPQYKTLWDSSTQGTYIKKKHGQLK